MLTIYEVCRYSPTGNGTVAVMATFKNRKLAEKYQEKFTNQYFMEYCWIRKVETSDV